MQAEVLGIRASMKQLKAPLRELETAQADDRKGGRLLELTANNQSLIYKPTENEAKEILNQMILATIEKCRRYLYKF